MVLHRNEPAPTLRIAIGDETIVATGIHRFWKANHGWTMARELKPGDRLRIVGGVTEVRSIENDKQQPVYNLDVAGNRDFFVGKTGLLVHDFSFVQPVAALFDRQPQLEPQPAVAEMTADRTSGSLGRARPRSVPGIKTHRAVVRSRTSTPFSIRNSRQRLGRRQ